MIFDYVRVQVPGALYLRLLMTPIILCLCVCVWKDFPAVMVIIQSMKILTKSWVDKE